MGYHGSGVLSGHEAVLARDLDHQTSKNLVPIVARSSAVALHSSICRALANRINGEDRAVIVFVPSGTQQSQTHGICDRQACIYCKKP